KARLPSPMSAHCQRSLATRSGLASKGGASYLFYLPGWAKPVNLCDCGPFKEESVLRAFLDGAGCVGARYCLTHETGFPSAMVVDDRAVVGVRRGGVRNAPQK